MIASLLYLGKIVAYQMFWEYTQWVNVLVWNFLNRLFYAPLPGKGLSVFFFFAYLGPLGRSARDVIISRTPDGYHVSRDLWTANGIKSYIVSNSFKIF